MSISQFVQKPLAEISRILCTHGAELKKVQLGEDVSEHTYLIKFDEKTKSSEPEINQLRGLIFNHQTGFIYSMTYPVPTEFKDLPDEEKKSTQTALEEKKFVIQEAMDGTLLRYWYHPELDRWFLSTNAVEDADHAFWMGHASFGDMFREACTPINPEVLNKDYIYLFTLCHPCNVIVVNHENAKIYHTTTYDRRTFEEVSVEIGVAHPPVLPAETTVEDVLKMNLESVSKPVTCVGYMMVLVPDKSGVVHRFRFENTNYTKARVLRGNYNNISMTILTHMLSPLPEAMVEFLQLYPIYELVHQQVTAHFTQMVDDLYNEYGRRYKLRQRIRVSKSHHWFLNQIHTKLYLGGTEPSPTPTERKPVQKPDILRFVRQQDVRTVYNLIGYD